VVITNANNDVVANTGLVAEHIPLTATATGGNEGQNCIATAQVTITQPEILVLLRVSLQMLLVLVKLMVDCCNQQSRCYCGNHKC
jgi:hypothetical protein